MASIAVFNFIEPIANTLQPISSQGTWQIFWMIFVAEVQCSSDDG